MMGYKSLDMRGWDDDQTDAVLYRFTVPTAIVSNRVRGSPEWLYDSFTARNFVLVSPSWYSRSAMSESGSFVPTAIC